MWFPLSPSLVPPSQPLKGHSEHPLLFTTFILPLVAYDECVLPLVAYDECVLPLVAYDECVLSLVAYDSCSSPGGLRPLFFPWWLMTVALPLVVYDLYSSLVWLVCSSPGGLWRLLFPWWLTTFILPLWLMTVALPMVVYDLYSSPGCLCPSLGTSELSLCFPWSLLISIFLIVWYPDPHGFGSPVVVLGMRIRIQVQGNWLKLTNKPNLQPFKIAFVPSALRWYVLWH
jgi:hypothetical protein